MWLRSLLHVALICLCLPQGVLSILSYTQVKNTPVLVYAVGCFLTAAVSIPNVWVHNCGLALVSSVAYAYYYACCTYLVVKLPQLFNEAKFSNHTAQISLPLALISMFVVGLATSQSMNSLTKPTDPEPESDTSSWQDKATPSPDDLSLNKSHRVHSQPPIVHLELDHLSEKTLRNKESDATLVVPVITHDELSPNWLLQASAAGLYDTGENWMSSNVAQLRHPSVSQSVSHQSSHKPSLSHSVSVRISRSGSKSSLGRSHTTGQLRKSSSVGDRLRSASMSENTLPPLKEAFSPKRLKTAQSHGALDGWHHKSSSTVYTPKGQNGQVTEPHTHSHHGTDTHTPDTHTYTHDTQNFNANGHTGHTGHTVHNVTESLKVTDGHNNVYDDHNVDPKTVHPDTNVPDHLYSEPPEMKSPSFVGHSPASSSGEFAMDGIGEIPMATPRWADQDGENWDGSMRNVTLQEWEAKKDHWLTLHEDKSPILYSSPTRKSVYSTAAPSLHTYREPQENASSNTLHSDHTLFRCTTPPQAQLHAISEPVSVDSSPIKKMIGRFKRRDSDKGMYSNTHKHSNSLTASMISVASGKSSRSGSPRKAMKSLFGRSSFEHARKPSYKPSYTGVHEADKIVPVSTALDRFWDLDTVDQSDKSRVSSVPSVVIGEYDREKWRTLKELERRELGL